MLPAQPNLSVINAIACLQLVVAEGAPIGTREAARRLGMEHTRVRRLLGTLAGVGLLERDERRRYRPGPGLHVLAAQSLAGSRLLQLTLPHLAALREPQRTVAVGVLWQGRVSFLVHLRPSQRIEEGIGSRGLHPATHSSLGHILLAHAVDRAEQLRALADAALTVDPGAVPDLRRGIDAMLDDARTRGWARLDFPNGEVSLAVGIGDPPVAAIGCSQRAPSADDIRRLAERLRVIADAIAAALREGLAS